MTEQNIEELVQSVFTFDNVGDSMAAVRRDLASESLQRSLVKEVVQHAMSKGGDNSPEFVKGLMEAAEARVARFVSGSKAAKGTGCGG